MRNIVDRYLDRILLYANRPARESQAIREEMEDHLWQKVEDLTETGLPREEAILKALRQHGPPKFIGCRLRPRFPWIDIRTNATARGVIAIGPRAIGIVAIGGSAVGIFAVGGLAFGVFALGTYSAGMFCAGGFALGWLFHLSMYNWYYWVPWLLPGIAIAAFGILQSHRRKADWLIEG